MATWQAETERPATGLARRVLVVDDDDQVRRLLASILEDEGYSCVLAADAVEARERLAETEFGLLLCDVNLPGESGLELIAQALEDHPGIATLMVSGVDDPRLAKTALDLGAYGYLTKPFRVNDVLIGIANAARRRVLEEQGRARQKWLEQAVRDRTHELEQTVARLERSKEELWRSQEETILRLSRAAESRDDVTGAHIERIREYVMLLSLRLGLPVERARELGMASSLHDIGKIAVPDRILLKEAPLTPEEREVMRSHTETGYRMLAGSSSRLLELAATVALTHHERYDGSGYPRGLAGEAIPFEGRIVAVADVFDALTSDRSYRRALPLDEAVELMREGSGTQLDPDVLGVLLESVDRLVDVRHRVHPVNNG